MTSVSVVGRSSIGPVVIFLNVNVVNSGWKYSHSHSSSAGRLKIYFGSELLAYNNQDRVGSRSRQCFCGLRSRQTISVLASSGTGLFSISLEARRIWGACPHGPFRKTAACGWQRSLPHFVAPLHFILPVVRFYGTLRVALLCRATVMDLSTTGDIPFHRCDVVHEVMHILRTAHPHR